MALQPLEQSGHIQLGQGFGFTGTALEVGSGREPAIPCEVKCPPLKLLLANLTTGLSQCSHVGSIKLEHTMLVPTCSGGIVEC